MILPNHKDIYKNVAEKYNLDLKLVEAIGSYTWSDLNDRIANFKNREIYVYKLGVWKFRKVKGEEYLKALRKEIMTIRKNESLSDKDKEVRTNKIVNKIRKIEVLVEEWNKIIEERKNFKDEQTVGDITKQR